MNTKRGEIFKELFRAAAGQNWPLVFSATSPAQEQVLTSILSASVLMNAHRAGANA